MENGEPALHGSAFEKVERHLLADGYVDFHWRCSSD
ncbi:hypothetical protein BCO37747_07640 [Burkholderia contaminans]|jgi:hypothetical protein|uniref:Uncharacterized protein n=1 Tax=Burkholderia aenigmatica TaxID=2015348 RepID=A0A6J5JSR0_9BURK|nr:hypothetical protein BLA3211_07920 [Burkholderia aenigmatica]VWD63251.1 hypothetical protein BCO37747_07640 [Burkholderia contaminans]